MITMNILILNYEYPPLGGGAGVATEALVKEFAKFDNLAIDIITSSTDTFRSESVTPNVTVHFLDVGKKNKGHLYQSEKDLLLYSVKAFFYIRKIKAKRKYGLIHAFFTVPCGFLAFVSGIPYIISLRGSDVPFHNPRFKIMDKFIFSWLSKLIWKKAEAVISNSQALLDEAKRVSPDLDIGLIPNGVNTELFRPEPFINKDEFIVRFLYTGRLAEVKGVTYLIDAFALAAKEAGAKRTELWIAGDGKLKEELKRKTNDLGISERVRFLDRVERDKMPALFRACDCFVLPSLSEGMPLALMEAMSSGMPVICSDIPSLREFVADGKNGFLVGKEDPKALSLALLFYIKGGREVIEEHGADSRDRAFFFDWKISAERYIEVYKFIEKMT